MNVLDQMLSTPARHGKAEIIGALCGVTVTEVVVSKHQKAMRSEKFGKFIVSQKMLAHAVRKLDHGARLFRGPKIRREIGFSVGRKNGKAFHKTHPA